MALESSLDGLNKRLSESAGYTERIQSAFESISKNAGSVRSSLASMAGVSNTTSGVGGKTPLGGGANFSTTGGVKQNNLMSTSLGQVSAQPVQPRATTTPASVGIGGASVPGITGGGGTGGGGTGGTGGSGGRGGNMLAGSLAAIGGAANATWQMTPGVMDAAAYQAALFPTAFAMQGAYSNRRAEQMIFNAAGQGASGVFDMQSAAALATSQGFSFNLNGGSTLSNMLGASSFAYQMTGMNNIAAMQGQAAMYQGTSGVSNRLMRVGIFNVDPTNGKPKDMGQIVDELWARFYGSKSAKITLEQFDADLSMGFLGSELSALFGDQPALYEQVVSFMRVKAKAGGKAGMTTNTNSKNFVGNTARRLGMTEYNAPQVASGVVNTSRSKVVGAASESGLMNAYVNSAYFLEDFNTAVQGATEALGPLSGAFYNVKGLLQSIGGSEAGPLLGLLSGGLSAGLRMIPGLSTGGVSGSGTSTSDSIPAMLSRGEYVINARAAQAIGLDNLNALNSMGQAFGSGYASPAKKFASGGSVVDGNSIADYANQFVGTPYVDSSEIRKAGKQPNPENGWDCSTFTQYVLKKFGVKNAPGVSTAYLSFGQEVPRDQIQPGDILVWDTDTGAPGPAGHVSIYAGNNEHIHAANPKIGTVRTPIGDYWKVFAGARRVSGNSLESPPDLGIDRSESDGSGDTSVLRSRVGANSIRRGIGSSAYSTVSSTSLGSLGKSDGNVGTFTSGFVSTTSVANNLNTISILRESTSSSVGESESGSSTGTSRTSSGKTRSSGDTGPLGSDVGFAKALLQAIGASTDGVPLTAMLTWMRHEGGHWKNSAEFNPLNTTQVMDGNDKSMNSHGVKIYSDWSEGLQATIKTLTLNKFGYPDIIKEFRKGDDLKAIYTAINNSSWGTKSLPGYSAGTPYVSSDQLAYLHQGETVIPAQATPDFRRALFEMMNGGGKAKTVNITLNIEKASDEEAERFARKVKRLLDNDSKMERLRSR